jgi:hypothetical protein
MGASMNSLRRRDPWHAATMILLIVLAVIISLTFRSYGVSWDEEFSHTQGRDLLDWYASGFHDRAVLSLTNNEYLYGGFFNGVAAFIADHLPFGTYESVHFVIAAAGLLGIFYAYRLGKLLAGPMAGFLSALILTLTPTYYGHSFMNPKDLPFAVFYLVSLYYIIRAYDELPRLSGRSTLVTGAAIGLALGIRVGGVMLLGYFALLIGLWHFTQYRNNPSWRTNAAWSGLRDSAVTFILVTFVAWVVMLFWWPFGQLDPILNPLAGVAKSASYADANWTNLYRGDYVQVNSLPWHYLPGLFLVTLPEFYVVALVGGLSAAVTAIVRRQRKGGKPDVGAKTKLLVFVFATFFPLVAAIGMKPTMYDGTRLFLFVIPPLAVLSGVSLAWLLSRVLPRVSKMALVALLVILGVTTLVDMIKLHPYEYVFFNRTSGGLRAAYGRYETEYWGVSYKEGAEWLIRNYKPDAPRGSIRVANTSNPFLTSYYLASDRPETQRFVQVTLDGQPDVILSITRWNQHLNYPGRVLHVVERMGTPLVYIIEVAGPSQP